MSYKNKVCIVCGKIFTPNSGAQIKCNECSKLNKNNKKTQYNKKETDERLRKEIPSSKLINEVKSLLNDFGIVSINIPEFNSISELDRWRKDMIMSIYRG